MNSHRFRLFGIRQWHPPEGQTYSTYAFGGARDQKESGKSSQSFAADDVSIDQDEREERDAAKSKGVVHKYAAVAMRSAVN